MTWLAGLDLQLGYGSTPVVHGVSVQVRPGQVTALIGPNGSGKSTILRAMARLHAVKDGLVQVGDSSQDLSDAAPLSARQFARQVTLLSQSRPHPSGLTVADVVAFGRHPHRRRFAAMSDQDRAAVARAMAITGLESMAGRPVDQLSGGELQRVWLSSCLAQQTGVLLLDEPTNHLDLRFQVEILDLISDLSQQHDIAIGVVLHDLNQAAGVADQVVLLARGAVRAAGAPADVLTAELLTEVYELPIHTSTDPDDGLVRVEARGRHTRSRRPSHPTTPDTTRTR